MIPEKNWKKSIFLVDPPAHDPWHFRFGWLQNRINFAGNNSTRNVRKINFLVDPPAELVVAPGASNSVAEPIQHLVTSLTFKFQLNWMIKTKVIARKPLISPKIRCWSRSGWSWNFHFHSSNSYGWYLSDATRTKSLAFLVLEILRGQTERQTDAKVRLGARPLRARAKKYKNLKFKEVN